MSSFLWYVLGILVVVGIASFSLSLFALLVVCVVVSELIIRHYGKVSETVDSAYTSVTSSAQDTFSFVHGSASQIHISEFASIMIILAIGLIVAIVARLGLRQSIGRR